MSAERDLIEKLVCSGTVTQYGKVIEVLYDPMAMVSELDIACYHCGAEDTFSRRSDAVEHSADCAWVEAMAYLGHPLPAGHRAGFVEVSGSEGAKT